MNVPEHELHVKVAVIFGGKSSEHSISCLSAASILAALDRTRYDVKAVGIGRDGSWQVVSDDPADWVRDGSELPEIPISETPGAILEGLEGVDVVFPVLHGPYGEDGTIQGALELAGIPYVGSGVLASAATMDKQTTKMLLTAAGLPVGPYAVVTDADWNRDQDGVINRIDALNYPVFVKPARAGSSVGISKVRSIDGLTSAIETAREHDRRVIVEESIENARELECGVLADTGFKSARASACAEITVGGDHEFYDFAAKYLDDSAQLSVPADIPESLHKELGEMAIAAFEALGCDGLARVDFFVSDSGAVVINEINTMPGFTNVSMYPRMWQASGISYTQLVDQLVGIALDRGTSLK